MAGKKGQTHRTPEMWTALLRRHLAGESAARIAAACGLTENWVTTKLEALKRDRGADAPAGYIDPVLRALARAEIALDDGRHDDAMKDIRAAAAIAKLRKETGMVTQNNRPAGKAGGRKGLTLEEARRILTDRMAKERRARGSGGERGGS
ncbi:MAG: hypothetical protein CMF74_08370 [Maricaulis sp.]|jgi:hypothetical protein|nr:hypothetical protein [Maricaulis sp.]HAQ36606.1 hypothetical protein [Alphaproteobacteria bacterium]|tara:strand:- start:97 stop:546 length:450 start_codon:yes stop_codon:yes gene_type:complete